MKVTPQQVQMIDQIVTYLNTWKTSNDMQSPSHYSLNYEQTDRILESIGKEEDSDSVSWNRLNNGLDFILSFVQDNP